MTFKNYQHLKMFIFILFLARKHYYITKKTNKQTNKKKEKTVKKDIKEQYNYHERSDKDTLQEKIQQ